MMDYIRKDTQRKSVINDAGKGEPVSRTLIVFYDGNVGKKPLKAALKRLDCKIIYDYRNLNGMAVEIPEKGDVNNIMKQLRKRRRVEKLVGSACAVHRDMHSLVAGCGLSDKDSFSDKVCHPMQSEDR